jgi:hypothetical protein
LVECSGQISDTKYWNHFEGAGRRFGHGAGLTRRVVPRENHPIDTEHSAGSNDRANVLGVRHLVQNDEPPGLRLLDEREVCVG